MSEERENDRDLNGDYISVPQASKLIPFSFDGNPRLLREFIEGVEAAHQLVHPNKHGLLLKFVEAKITGEAKERVLARTHRPDWPAVKSILEESYAIKRTLEYYAGTLFNARQNDKETVAQWGARLDLITIDLLRESKLRVERQISADVENREAYIEGGQFLIMELVKGTFVAGLKDERIKYIVKAKSDNESMAQLVEFALQEENEIKSQRFKGLTTDVFDKYKYNYRGEWRNRSNVPISDQSRFRVKQERNEVKKEVNLVETRQCYRCEGWGHLARDCPKTPRLKCNTCGRTGHDARSCRMKQGNRQ